MDIYTLLFVIAESVILLIISAILFQKSVSLSKLRKEADAFQKLQEKTDNYVPLLVHELRAPLSVIKGASDLMLKDVSNLSAEQIQTLLSQIRSSSTSLLHMVDDILDVSKLEEDKFEISKTFGNINNVIREECSYFQSLAQVKDIILDFKVDEKVQSFSFDPDRIKQVLNNLLSNAIKFTEKKGHITVTSQKLGGEVHIGVCDTGVGVKDKDKDKLFRKFVQINNHENTKEKGTGLGLVISKGIVTAHGGKIWVEDNKPKGICFIFSVPLN